MSANPTVLVLGRRRTDNMPSLTRMLEILKPASVPGMDATVSSSVRITGVTEPMMGKCWVCGAETSGTVCDSCNKGPDITPVSATCVTMGGCPMGGACVADPIDQAKVDQCPEC